MHPADKVVELAQTRFSWPGAGASVVALPALSVTRGERVFLRGKRDGVRPGAWPAEAGLRKLDDLVCWVHGA